MLVVQQDGDEWPHMMLQPVRCSSTSLRSLELLLSGDGLRTTLLDLSPLANLSLEELIVDYAGHELRDISSLKGQAQMRRLLPPLCVSCGSSDASEEDWQEVLAVMPLLQELWVPYLWCDTVLWRVLAQLEHLRNVSLGHITIGDGPPSAVTDLYLTEGIGYAEAAAGAAAGAGTAGILATALPELQALDTDLYVSMTWSAPCWQQWLATASSSGWA